MQVLRCFFCGFLFGALNQAITDQEKLKTNSLAFMVPELEFLSKGWTKKELIYNIDTLSETNLFITPDQPDPEAFKNFLNRRLDRLNCEAMLKVHYAKENFAVNSGGHYLFIYRWENSGAAEEAWQEILAKAPLDQKDLPSIGNQACWAHQNLFQSIAFRRNNYIVRVDCGRSEVVFGLLDLAEAVDDILLNLDSQ